MRKIDKIVGSKMPTVYYYFKNKGILFDEVARINFESLVERLEKEISKDLSLKEAYIHRAINKKFMSADEKLIYKLAMKTWLGFEGCEVSRKNLFEWERTTYERTYIKCMEETLWYGLNFLLVLSQI